MNTGVNVSFWIMFFSRYGPRSGIAGSHGSSVFSFLRNLHTILHSGYTNLHSHPQCGMVPFSFFHSLSSIYCLYNRFLMMTILISVKVSQSFLTLCNPMDCNPPDSSVHGILQARMLEWIAIPCFPSGSDGKESASNAGDRSSIAGSGLGRYPG